MAKINKDKIELFSQKMKDLKEEIAKVVYGQENVIETVVKSVACDGHTLLEGVPGTGKTLIILTLSQIIEGAESQRIQFTPDLLPSDITGTTIYREDKGFEVKKGPIFSNIIAADEINRTPPKVQSAMLQAMQEREVTIGKETHKLPGLFIVIATQNPLETKGIYPLPEAQIDRFLFKLNVGYSPRKEEKRIIGENMEVKDFDYYELENVMTKNDILKLQELVPQLNSSKEIKKYIVNIVNATRHPDDYNISHGKYVQWGGSPRATIFLNLAGKANALMNGRNYVTPEDVREVSYPVLRHRIILNYEGKAERIKKNKIIDEVLSKVPVV
ncbi:MAG: AAA family ATPase [Candidatus Aenigmatarchaeota archaeon]